MLGIGSLTARVWFLKIGLCRVIRIPDIIIHTGTRLLVVCGKHIDGWGVGHRARLSLHIPSAYLRRTWGSFCMHWNEKSNEESVSHSWIISSCKQSQRYNWIYRNSIIIIPVRNKSCYFNQKNNSKNDWLRKQILKIVQVKIPALQLANLKSEKCLISLRKLL